MNMLTLLYFLTSKQPKNKGYPQNPIKSVATTNTTHQEHTSPGARTYLYCSKPLKICFSSTSPLLDPSIQEKHYKCFGFTRLIWTWKYISTLPGEKGYAYYPERILDDIFLLFTVSPPWPQILFTMHGWRGGVKWWELAIGLVASGGETDRLWASVPGKIWGPRETASIDKGLFGALLSIQHGWALQDHGIHREHDEDVRWWAPQSWRKKTTNGIDLPGYNTITMGTPT